MNQFKKFTVAFAMVLSILCAGFGVLCTYHGEYADAVVYFFFSVALSAFSLDLHETLKEENEKDDGDSTTIIKFGN